MARQMNIQYLVGQPVGVSLINGQEYQASSAMFPMKKYTF